MELGEPRRRRNHYEEDDSMPLVNVTIVREGEPVTAVASWTGVMPDDSADTLVLLDGPMPDVMSDPNATFDIWVLGTGLEGSPQRIGHRCTGWWEGGGGYLRFE
ncbi:MULTISPECIES: hypothetical protein [unclassified Streptomyces]|uniref:hypothetical protein n=1 Tax=unclassified Streptomyces TaxID=2593676 RepID=UPI003862FE12|nr:hypothetical protein OG331_04195 [Streptomyces sp. NBC_01017]WSV34766.1 hypothetical protein OG331_47785 [Streptomyces sp. NBC_01017]